MAAENEDEATGTGCAKKGCGCVGVLLLLAIGSWILDVLFFRYPFASWGIVVSGGLLLGGGGAGLFLGAYVSDTKTRRQFEDLAPYILGFGALCLVTAVGMSLRPSSFSFEEQVASGGGTVGPIEITEPNTRIGVHVHQSIQEGTGQVYQRWSFVTLELLDENKEYLSSFGGEFWHYAGYDDGHWEEEDEEFETTIRVPSAGTYYIDLQTEANVAEAELSPITLHMQERAWWGYPVPLRWAAYIALFAGGALLVAPRVGRSSQLVSHLRDQGAIRFDGKMWRVRNEVHYEYSSWNATEWVLHPTDPGAKMPHYLEREYETDSNWESWMVSRPVQLDDLRVGGGASDRTVADYVSQRGELPDGVVYEDTLYSLENSGTARREGTRFSFHLYEHEKGGFVTIEGEPDDDLEAVVGRKVSVSELSVAEESAST